VCVCGVWVCVWCVCMCGVCVWCVGVCVCVCVCVFVALVSQHAMRMRRIAMCGLACYYTVYFHISHKNA